MKQNKSSKMLLAIGAFIVMSLMILSLPTSGSLAAPPCGSPQNPCATPTPGTDPTPTPTPTSGSEPTSGNLIYNGDFSNGLHRWSMAMDNTAMAYRSVVNGEYVLNIEDTGNNTWSLMLERWDLDIVQGRTYAVYFDARATQEGRTILAGSSYREKPWTSYSGDIEFALSTTMERYSYTFTMNEPTDWDGRIVFQFGTGLNPYDVVLDNIAMYDLTGGQVPAEPTLPSPSSTFNTLIWSDEFDSTAVDETNWNFDEGGSGWGNQELQFYKRENATVANGMLTITAKEESYRGKSYTSARLTTMDKQYFKYGRIEMRADLPEGQGIWPAFWTLGQNYSTVGWPHCGEIDIMEMVGGGEMRDDTSYGVMHWSDASGNHDYYGESNTIDPGNLGDGFHTYGIVWDETGVYYFVDGIQFNFIDTTGPEFTEFHDPHFILINLAVGGVWPGHPDTNTTFPQEYKIDYIRVYQ